MKDFNSFKSDVKNEEKNFKKGSPYDLFAMLSQKYEGKSYEEIMQAIIKQAEESRKNGTLTDEDIDNFASTVSPLLNEKQRKLLSSVVLKLKKI